MPYPTNTTAQEAFPIQPIEISLDSTSKAVSTLDLMLLTSIPVGIPGAFHLDTMHVLEPMYNLILTSCFHPCLKRKSKALVVVSRPSA